MVQRSFPHPRRRAPRFLLLSVAVLATGIAFGQAVVDPPKVETLVGVRVPDPSGTEGGVSVTLGDYVVDRAAALRLGKALFWDVTVGSDGQTACASCHYHAGSDQRYRNVVNPGPNGAFDKPPFSQSWGPNYQVRASDFPLHRLADVNDRDSSVLSSTNDVIGAAGVFDRLYKAASRNTRFDKCVLQAETTFQVGGVGLRRVTGRQSPTTINAALNVRNFWDGRANNIFNGFSPFGNRDPDAGIFVTSPPGATPNPAAVPVKTRLALKDASAASQAVGPPLSGVEMSCGGRTFADIANRILDSIPLPKQNIAVGDSVLASWDDPAVRPTYRQLIQTAFHPRLWNGTTPVSFEPTRTDVPTYSQMAANFTLFFGLAIQIYESTLLSDDTPLDKHLRGVKLLTGAELRGLDVFTGKGKCVNCHNGPELTGAATRLRRSPQERVERMVMGDGQIALYDNAFYNIGVRPTADDVGVGGTDPWGNPLSFTRQYRTLLQGGSVPDPFKVDVCSFAVLLTSPCDPAVKPSPDFRDAVDGAFKVPTLRNVALTGPYFHNGGQATLEQVVAFYNRGGDRRGNNAQNTSGFGANPSNLDPDIEPLGLTADEQADLVAFLRNALTDPRVAWEKAPFDHPSLVIRDGHPTDEWYVAPVPRVDMTKPLRGYDNTTTLKAVGKGGRSAATGPLQAYEAGLAP